MIKHKFKAFFIFAALMLIALAAYAAITADVSQATGTTNLGIRDAVSKDMIAQSFIPNFNHLDKVSVKLVRSGTPTGNLFITIEADSGGNPSGTPLDTSGNLDVSTITGTQVAYDFPFTNGANVRIGSTYWIVCHVTYSVSAANFISAVRSTTSPYAGGTRSSYDSSGPGWVTAASDLYFVTYYDTAKIQQRRRSLGPRTGSRQ